MLAKKSINNVDKLLSSRKSCVVWGCGSNFAEYMDLILQICDIAGVYDKDLAIAQKYKQFQICKNIEDIQSNQSVVVITMAREELKLQVAQMLDTKSVDFVFLDDLIAAFRRKKLLETKIYSEKQNYYLENDKMKAYIGILIPEYVCNLKCRYCYISQSIPLLPKITRMTGVAKHLRNVLSRKNLGGAVLVGLCGSGETFLGDSFDEICLELLKEGHYLHIVTNGLLTEKIIELINAAEEYAAHIIFKLSFHYEELESRDLLMTFVQTVKFIEQSAASYTIELMPHDEIIPKIDEIKKFSYQYFGALPHITVARDNREGFSLLSDLSYEEYYDIWKQFDSSLFEYKMKQYQSKGCNCYAGRYGLNIELEQGIVSRCTTVDEYVGNIYEMDAISLDYEPVRDNCPLSYCYNCHVYGPLGVMLKDEEVPTYLEVRDRVKLDGSHWVKEPMAKFIGQKIHENY